LEKLKSPPEGLEALLRDLAATPAWDRDPVWVHGDLYSRHLIVDSANLVCGVIDWGDAHVGDPALDLAIAWMFLPPTAWPEFIAAYGGIDSATWRRARFRAITHWVYLREYAESREDANLLREFEFLLENVTQDASV
jgi:aminoglycoside phosphotransferase (APT) family kinase protein